MWEKEASGASVPAGEEAGAELPRKTWGGKDGGTVTSTAQWLRVRCAILGCGLYLWSGS